MDTVKVICGNCEFVEIFDYENYSKNIAGIKYYCRVCKKGSIWPKPKHFRKTYEVNI